VAARRPACIVAFIQRCAFAVLLAMRERCCVAAEEEPTRCCRSVVFPSVTCAENMSAECVDRKIGRSIKILLEYAVRRAIVVSECVCCALLLCCLFPLV